MVAINAIELLCRLLELLYNFIINGSTPFIGKNTHLYQIRLFT